MANEQDEVIVDDVEDINEEVTEPTEAKVEKTEKPKRTPQEEFEYHKGRADRLAKKHGFTTEKPEPKKDSSSKPNELDYGQKAYLNSYGIKGSDELTLVRQFQERGFDLDAIVQDDIFTSKLNNLRQARESASAIPKGAKRSAQNTVDDVDVAYAKFEETGKLPEDFNTRVKVIDRMTAKKNGPGF